MFLDESLHRHFQTLPALPFSKVLQAPADVRAKARRAFLQSGQLPTFTYPKVDKIDLEGFRAQAKAVRNLINNDPSPTELKKLYLDKLSELETRADLIDAVHKQNDQLVSKLSLKLFGTPDTHLEIFENEFSERMERARKGEVHYHDKIIGAEEFCSLLKQALEHYLVPNWTIKLSPRRRLLCSHNHKAASIVFRVPKKLSISRERARRLIAHEIEVHTLRRLNGADSRLHILKRGLAGYSKTEEGLALYHQHKRDTGRKHLPGFWDAWASTLMYRAGFAAAYHRLYQAQLDTRNAKDERDARKQAQLVAWNLCLRSSRGIAKPGAPGIGYFRDHIYRQGYQEVAAAVERYGENNILPLLFVGKIGLDDLPVLEQFELKPGRLPDDIGRKLVKKV